MTDEGWSEKWLYAVLAEIHQRDAAGQGVRIDMCVGYTDDLMCTNGRLQGLRVLGRVGAMKCSAATTSVADAHAEDEKAW